ncbi:MAG: gamma carbonic anhydrase family protein [Rhodobacteraceae bacterium]|nr:gamma carbonic anhydrase family protein [Paracoccaceae bacterium]MCY4197838.1 gamma carbonic anhydrase family protein [Paracoccaceae bacterium]
MTLYRLGDRLPAFSDRDSCWIAPDANLIGDVRIGAKVSIWFGATLRGDNEPIIIEDGTNIQEGCILHTDIGLPLIVEQNCIVGHQAILHSCRIRRGGLIGMGATLLNDCDIGENSVVGAGALVTAGKTFPPASLILGSPARCVRTLRPEEIDEFAAGALHYQDNIDRYRSDFSRLED